MADGSSGLEAAAYSSLLGLPPHNIEAEQTLLATILVYPEVLGEIGDAVNEASFYREQHKAIFRVLVSLDERRVPIDALTVQTELESRNELNLVGGRGYLISLTEALIIPSHVTYHAKIIAECYFRRLLRDFALSVLSLVKDPPEGAGMEDLADLCEASLSRAQAAVSSSGWEATRLEKILKGSYARIKSNYASGDSPRGTPYGMTALDDVTRGMRDSSLIVVAGRPGMGKTAFAIDVGKAVAARGVGCLVFSGEMPNEDIGDRDIAAGSRVSWDKIDHRKLTRSDTARMEAYIESIEGNPIWIDDEPGLTLPRIRSRARKIKRHPGKYPLGLVIVDYLQIVRKREGAYRADERDVGEVAQGMKELAMELDIPVICLAQLNREVERREDKRPLLSDLRDSGQIEQAADVVWFLYRDAYYASTNKGKPLGGEDPERVEEVEVILAKNRNGPTTVARYGFQPTYTRFVPLETRGYDEPTGF